MVPWLIWHSPDVQLTITIVGAAIFGILGTLTLSILVPQYWEDPLTSRFRRNRQEEMEQIRFAIGCLGIAVLFLLFGAYIIGTIPILIAGWLIYQLVRSSRFIIDKN